MKERFGGWLDEHWDHAMILQAGDPLIEAMDREGSRLYVVGCPPTAENLAEIAFNAACNTLPLDQLTVERVRVYETPNCWAEYP